MAKNRKNSSPRFKRRVYKGSGSDTLGLIALWLFFPILIIGVLTNASRSMIVGVALGILIIVSLALALCYRPDKYESEIDGIIGSVSEVGDRSSKVFVSDLASRYPKAIEVSYMRISLWVTKKGFPVNYMTVDLDSPSLSLVVNKKQSPIPFVKFYCVMVIDKKTGQSYSVIPYERVSKLMIPDFTGMMSQKVVDEAKKSGYTELSFDDL